jgi:hypothetical protein
MKFSRLKEKSINLEALFTGGNPFEAVDGVTHNNGMSASDDFVL